jgi:2'-5' RNA ligase
MKLSTYCVAHVVREQEYIKQRIREMRQILDKRRLQTFTPSLGHHVTLLPPFRTTDEAAKLLAWGLDVWDTVRIGEKPAGDEDFGATGVGFDFFRSEKEDAFVIRLMVQDYLARAVERGRKRIPEIAEWVYPPANYDFNPHLTIVTGKGIADSIETLVEEGVLPKSYTENFFINFEAPRVFRKVEAAHSRWEPVL